MTSPKKKRILVTDDEPDIVDIIVDLLGLIGYEAIKTYDGPGCIEAAIKESPDLIFLDIMMEGMDGWEAARRLKQEARTKDIPIIMVTAKPLTLEDVRDRAFLIENYIMKPVSRATLKEAIEDIFTSRSQLERIMGMAAKSGVKTELLEQKKERYSRLYAQNRTNKKLLNLLSQIYTEKKLKDNPGWQNMMTSLKKGISLQEQELEKLEKFFKSWSDEDY
jgi:CheY-like chemotaxis protein